MEGKWKIIYYEAESGHSPIRNFIKDLELKTRAKVSGLLDLLKEFGVNVGLPYAQKLSGTELWELRILGQDNIRIFYVAIIGRRFLLLHGFKKKKQKQTAEK